VLSLLVVKHPKEAAYIDGLGKVVIFDQTGLWKARGQICDHLDIRPAL
jgi:hypothetical protein